jgi:hypothetical protein
VDGCIGDEYSDGSLVKSVVAIEGDGVEADGIRDAGDGSSEDEKVDKGVRVKEGSCSGDTKGVSETGKRGDVFGFRDELMCERERDDDENTCEERKGVGIEWLTVDKTGV